MARLLMVLTVVFHLVVPLALAGWAAFAMPESRIHLISKMALVASFVGLLWTAGAGWHVVGTLLRPIVAGLTGAALLVACLRWPDLAWWRGGLWPTGLLVAVWFLIGGFLATSWASLGEALEPPEVETVDLTFPLVDGDYYVFWGGSSPATNRHMKVLDGKDHYRGQAYAHDIVELNRLGTRAAGLLPSKPSAYEIFGAKVAAPCKGRVVRAVGDRPDLNPPNRSDGPPAGNHVLLRCDGYEVLLAHLEQGSLEVAEGETVEIGHPLGLVGNSGNTTEPHLHVHAQRPADDGPWMSGDPIAVTFDGEFTPKGTTISR